MPRPFGYKLSFTVDANISPAVRKMQQLRTVVRDVVGPQATRGRVQAETAETAATKGTTGAIKGKEKAHLSLMQVMGRGLKVYWTLVSVFYMLRNIIGGVIGFYRQLIGVVQRGIGIFMALGSAVISNTAEFEKLRIVLEAISPSAEFGRRTFEKLQKFVVGMPFTLREAADAFKYLEATGVRASMGFERSLRVAGTMAVAMDRDIMSAGLAIAKFRAGYMQRLTRGFAITAETLIPYGAVPGASPGTLEYKAPGAAQKNVEALYKFVEDRWGTLLDRMRNSWQQLVADMTDIWQIVTATIGFAGVLDAMKSLLLYVRTTFEFLRDTGVIKRWADAIGKAWKPVIESVGPWLERLPGIMETVVGWIEGAGDAMQTWLDKMGGLEGIWDRLLEGVRTHGPEIVELLRTYANIMISIGRAVTVLAAGLASAAESYYGITGQEKKARAATRVLGGMDVAWGTQGNLGDTLNKVLDDLSATLAGLTVGGGAFPGQERYAPGMPAATGGELRNLKTKGDMSDAVETGTTAALEKVFGKGGMKDNPFVALYQMLTGQMPPSAGAGPSRTAFARGPGYPIHAAIPRPSPQLPQPLPIPPSIGASAGGGGYWDTGGGGGLSSGAVSSARLAQKILVGFGALNPPGLIIGSALAGMTMERRLEAARKRHETKIQVNNYMGNKAMKPLLEETVIEMQSQPGWGAYGP